MIAPVSVVIPHYFQARRDHLPIIVAAFQSGDPAPAEIIIWNNEPHIVYVEGAKVIQSARNIGCQGRFLAALTATQEFICCMDNDTLPEVGMLGNLFCHATEMVDPAILTLEGRIRPAEVPYRQWPKLHGCAQPSPVEVTMSLGRGEFFPRRILGKLLADFQWNTAMDDLWWSACAAVHRVPIVLTPSQKGRNHLRNIRGEAGLSNEPGYYGRRNDAVDAILYTFPHIWRVGV